MKMKSQQDAAVISLSALSLILCTGCANPGPPKPPSLHLPAVVKDLGAQRVGDRVLLNWTTPAKTTDDGDVKGAITAEICREAGSRPTTPKKRLTACSPVRRLAVTPGASEVWDELPTQLVVGPPVLLTYRVQLFNSVGRSAGDSAAAYAAAGAAPSAVEGLKATGSEAGAVIEWRRSDNPVGLVVDLKRIDLTPSAAQEKKSKPVVATPIRKKGAAQRAKPEKEPQNEVHLRVADGTAGIGMSGTLDATVEMENTYTYVAERVREVTIGSHTLEVAGATSAEVTLTMQDTFPPKVPTGVATVPGETAAGEAKGPYIDLSWEPNGETDLAGYFVYRQLARSNGDPQGPLAKLTPLPIAAPAYRDVAVKAGQGYIYSVTAVDASGNESAPSAKAQETAQIGGDSPQ